MRLGAAAVLALLAMLAGASSARADTWVVTAPGDGGECNLVTKQCPSLRAALTAANGTKEVKDIIGLPPGAISINNDLVVNSEVEIIGASARTTIIDGNFKYRGFRVTSNGSDVDIRHLTIRDGAANGGSGDGGGILNEGGNVLLDHVRITGARAESGAGIANVIGTLNLQYSLVDTNVAAGDSGGILNLGNADRPALLGIRDSTIARNSAGSGGTGGIHSRGNVGNALALQRTTVADNSAGVRGVGGLEAMGDSTFQARATIVARNTVTGLPSNCGVFKPTDLGYNVENEKNCTFDLGGVNPGLGLELTNAGGEIDVLALTAGSPAIDRAPICTGFTDQRDVGRPQGRGCDAGGYEFDQAPEVTISSGPDGTITSNGGSFVFSSPEPGVRYECELTGPGRAPGFADCSSPRAYDGLAEGRFTFSVRAIDGVFKDPPVTTRPFIVNTGPPNTTITGGPSATVASTSATFTYTSTEADSTFQCSLDSATFGACPASYTGLAQGEHLFRVRAVDAAGTLDGTPASQGWTVDTAAPPAPVVSSPASNALLMTGTVEFRGTAEPASTVRIRESGISQGTSPASGTGNWTVILTPLDGPHEYAITATDAAGNESTATVWRITVDTKMPETAITGGPAEGAHVNTARPTFTFSSEAGAKFECSLDGVAHTECPTPYTTPTLTQGPHTLSVRAFDPAGNRDNTPATRNFTVDTGPPPAPAVTSGPAGLVNASSATFGFSGETGATFACSLDGAEFSACTSPKAYDGVGEGDHTFRVRQTDVAGNPGPPAARPFSVDRTPPAEPVVSGGAAGFEFAADAGTTVECKLDGPGGQGSFQACSSPQSFSNLTPGGYVFHVRSTDAAGNSRASSRTFTIAAVQPAQTPAPTPTPEPTPVAQQTVVVVPSGKVRVRLPGSNRFEDVDVTKGVPLGSEIDVKNGRVEIQAIPRAGAPVERATFYGGIFVITQRGGVTDLRLSEPLTGCSSRARAAQGRKVKSRKLWGDGRGRFRTTGQYSAATVRGTRWLVQDTCTTTITRVVQGVVAVRDTVLRKTVLVRRGQRYTARRR